jgi:hypothetical protein
MRTAAAQGLSVGSDNLGAGAEFELFEDSLHLSTTGGKGKGGRGVRDDVSKLYHRILHAACAPPLLLLLLLLPQQC